MVAEVVCSELGDSEAQERSFKKAAELGSTIARVIATKVSTSLQSSEC